MLVVEGKACWCKAQRTHFATAVGAVDTVDAVDAENAGARQLVFEVGCNHAAPP